MLKSIQRHGSVPAGERENEGERMKERKEKERGKRRGRCSGGRRLARWCGRRRPQWVCADTTQLLCRTTLSSQAQQEVPEPAQAAATSSWPPNRSPCWGSRVAAGPQAGVEAFPTRLRVLLLAASSPWPAEHQPTAMASDANTPRLYSNQTCEYLPECFKIDPTKKAVHCCSAVGTNLDGNGDFMVDYDCLAVALGATVNTFNTPGVMEHCHFLKVVEDAQKIQKIVIDCFEKASLPNLSEEEKRKILHVVIIGGGPTGLEFAAELHDFLVEDLVKLYPAIEEFVKITIIQSGEHILNTSLRNKGIILLTVLTKWITA